MTAIMLSWIAAKHCTISIRRGTVSTTVEYTFGLRFITGPCPVKKKIVMQLFQPTKEFLIEKTFLLDILNNLDRRELRDLVELSNVILEGLNTLILFATPEQAAVLKKTDTFQRLPFIDFQLPDRNSLGTSLKSGLTGSERER